MGSSTGEASQEATVWEHPWADSVITETVAAELAEHGIVVLDGVIPEEVCSGVLCEILDTETKHGLKVSENPCNAG